MRDTYIYVHLLTRDYKNSAGTHDTGEGSHQSETFPAPETQAPCPWPNFKYLVISGIKAMASYIIALTVGDQFPRLSHKDKHPICFAFTNGNLR